MHEVCLHKKWPRVLCSSVVTVFSSVINWHFPLYGYTVIISHFLSQSTYSLAVIMRGVYSAFQNSPLLYLLSHHVTPFTHQLCSFRVTGLGKKSSSQQSPCLLLTINCTHTFHTYSIIILLSPPITPRSFIATANSLLFDSP